MIPVKLTISGFLSYKEPAEIDFTGLHVACITGRNGAGKSAMLDAMTWVLFGEARKNDDSVINDLVQDQTARVDFEFRYENAVYLVRRHKKKGKSTVVEFYIRSEDGTWKSLTEKKGTDTNRRICDTLHMDYKTFINVSFFLQGKADQFTGQNATERKKILSSILNLEIWETYKAKASEHRKDAEASVNQLSRLMLESEEELKEEDELKRRMQEILGRITEAKKVSDDLDRQWELAKTAEAALQGQNTILRQKQLDEDRQARQLRGLQEILASREKDLEVLRKKAEGAETIRRRYEELQEVRKKLEKLDADSVEFNRIRAERSAAENLIQSMEKQLRYEYSQLLREKNELEKLAAELRSLREEADRDSGEISSLTDDCARKPELQERFDAVLEQGNQLKAAGELLISKINETAGKIETLRNNQGALCPTCGREMDAEHCRKHEAELREQLGSLRQGQAENEAARIPVRKEYAELQKELKRLDDLQTRLADLKVRFGTASQRIRLISDRQSAWESDKEARFTELEKILRENSFCLAEREAVDRAERALAGLQYDRRTHEQVRSELGSLLSAEQDHLELIRSMGKIEPLEREIEEKKARIREETEHMQKLRTEREHAEEAYRELNEKMPDISRIEKLRDEAADSVHKLTFDLGSVRQKLNHLDEARSNLDRYGKEFREKRALIERYKTLEKAFGKDGVPALLIEQAIPEIEEEANLLLQKLSNGTMSLKMNTQGMYKSKKDEVRETLEIQITDPYGTREYEMFSGGEAFRINFSIRLALSRILAQRAGSRLQTLVIDEGFGSQDDEGRARLAEVITAVQHDFEKILVITHLTELKEEFPSRIEVEKTSDGSKVEVIL